MKKKIRVVILDDHRILRDGIKMLLNNEEDIELVSDVGREDELYPVLNARSVDILLLDLTLDEKSGFEVLGRVVENYPDINVIILTMHENSQYIKRALNLGAKGYVSKRCCDRDLINAIRSVSNGGVFIDSSLAKCLATESENSEGVKLSEREIQVLKYLVRGFTGKEIAAKLNISMKTVETYKLRITEKTGISARPELLQYAIKNGLFDPEDI
jgi:two-component system response regulator NreC